MNLQSRGKETDVNDAIWSQALMVFIGGFSGVFLGLVLLMLSVMAMRLLVGNEKQSAKTAGKGDKANG